MGSLTFQKGMEPYRLLVHNTDGRPCTHPDTYVRSTLSPGNLDYLCRLVTNAALSGAKARLVARACGESWVSGLSRLAEFWRLDAKSLPLAVHADPGHARFAHSRAADVCRSLFRTIRGIIVSIKLDLEWAEIDLQVRYTHGPSRLLTIVAPRGNKARRQEGDQNLRNGIVFHDSPHFLAPGPLPTVWAR